MSSHLLPILYYHHVGVRQEQLGHRSLWVSRQRFSEQMAYLSSRRYQCMSVRESLGFLEGTKATPKRTVVLTFDDGYENFYQYAYPILERYGFHATVFVVTAQIGELSQWDAASATKLMDWNMLRELNRSGIEIGSHTVNHPRLSKLEPGVAKKELTASRQTLEQNLGETVLSLAYPYGDWNDGIVEMARQAGYRSACATMRGNRHAVAHLHRLKRVPVDESTSMERFGRKLTSVYDFTCRLRRWSRRLRRRQV